MIQVNGFKNRNFAFKELSEKFKDFANERLIGETDEIIYAYETFEGDTAIITVVNKQKHKLYIYRIFDMNNKLHYSCDGNLEINEVKETVRAGNPGVSHG